MLFDLHLIKRLLTGIDICGVLHIGAHECEEMKFYRNYLNLLPANIIWVEAMENKVAELIEKDIPNVYNAVITDKNDDIVFFNVANNGESSSVLDFNTHATQHPDIKFIDKIQKTTITVDSFFERNKLDASKCHFWNIDIQGAELMALRGSKNSIKHARVIYLEVNKEELYKGCGLINDIDLFLSESGFERVSTIFTSHGWGDALYIHSNLINDSIRNYMNHPTIKIPFANKQLYEFTFYQYFKNQFNIIFDVGSQDNSIYRDFQGDVHYFEPVGKLLEQLSGSFKKNKTSKFNNFMLSNKTQGDFQRLNYENISPLLKTGKEYMIENQISNIDLLKIDNCFKLINILFGFQELLKNVKIIQFTWFDNEFIPFIHIINYLKLQGFANFAYLNENGPEAIVDFSMCFEYCTIVCIQPKSSG
uniref:Methyltransferase FkbM domain-containing protein n=1 Tax=viral metagenome TaxID=1070528 RepID=A0A6C0JHD4_9ZZZZ